MIWVFSILNCSISALERHLDSVISAAERKIESWKDLPEAKDNSFIRKEEKNRPIEAHAIHVSQRNILYSFSIKIGEKDDSCSS